MTIVEYLWLIKVQRDLLANCILNGDASRAHKFLGWKATTSFTALIDMMVAADLEQARKEGTLMDAGYQCGGRNSGA